ncbi:ABC transporter substrate-binding protein [Prosthecomicrobium sp. N25]|uniref:ABC transporter substrate-binding protein n=1 Tax=Prosthecomicrobium sp. N25 TaxID=3129254 RepID=UPI0030784B84
MAAVAAFLWAGPAAAAELTVGIISQKPPPPPIYDQDPLPEDHGIAGGRLAVRDSNTTGRLVGQSFKLEEVVIEEDGDPVAAFAELTAKGLQFIVLNLPADKVLKVSDAAKGKEITLFNAGAQEDALRGENCRDNVMHVAPSRSMLTDSLAQYLVWKRWRNWLVIYGPHPGDQAYLGEVRRAAKKFAGKIVAEKEWTFGPDGRRTAQQEVPLLTQGLSYDVVVIADEVGEFGDYVEFHTWDPRPTSGTQGLTPTTWHPQAEQHGAVQLNNRFKRLANRPMTALDFNVWMAVRTVTETAPRVKSVDYKPIVDYIRGPSFELAAFKGVGLTFRDWDWQLRQPILLAQPAALVSMSPQPGFLHQRTPLDTLGTDKPESKCKLK